MLNLKKFIIQIMINRKLTNIIMICCMCMCKIERGLNFENFGTEILQYTHIYKLIYRLIYRF